MTKGRIAGIKRFETHDGEGIRTTLFLKGCPLKCEWCHNPEAISPKPQIAFLEGKCIGCGECVSVCPVRAHSLSGGKHIYDRSICINCGKCAGVCRGDALTFYGNTISPEDALLLLLEDRIFYESSGGGITLSGGEPLLQADFCMELLKLLKREGIHTAVDTSGFAIRKELDKIIDYTDIFLHDIKFYDDVKHIRYTGQSNIIILENLEYINVRGKPVDVRIPFIPKVNDDQIEPIGQFLATMKSVVKITLVPYHNLASNKYVSLEMENTLPDVKPPGSSQLMQAVNILKSYGLNAAVSGK